MSQSQGHGYTKPPTNKTVAIIFQILEGFRNMWCNLLAELDFTDRKAQQYSLDTSPPPDTHTPYSCRSAIFG